MNTLADIRNMVLIWLGWAVALSLFQFWVA
jgi:hypothetical protein